MAAQRGGSEGFLLHERVGDGGECRGQRLRLDRTHHTSPQECIFWTCLTDLRGVQEKVVSHDDAFRSRKYVVYLHVSVVFVLNNFKECKIIVFRVRMEYSSCFAASLQLRSADEVLVILKL